MKFIITSLFFVTSLPIFAQWSDITNLFTDSLHTQVTNAPNNQGTAIIVRSYPDSGYFVIWQDARNDASGDKTFIYAQKYSKTGSKLWAANGIAVSASTNRQHYYYNGQDYRNRSYAATDSADGFYVAYADDSVNTYVYERACVQHVKSNGTTVFGGPGHIISSSTAGNLAISPQLVADSYGGFFYSFITPAAVTGVPISVFMYDFKDVNGTLQSYGGGQMNENAVQVTASSTCGNYTYLNYTDAEVEDYNIFPDLQGGCNIVMSLNVNGQPLQLAYNKLWRAKKNATATEHYLDENYNDSATALTYKQGNVYRLYYLRTDHQRISCGDGMGGIVVVTQYRLVQNGFQEIDGSGSLYDLSDPKGVTVNTAGNINATLLATSERTYSQATGVSDAIVKGYVVKEEIYDSIPYQRASSNDASYPGYNTNEPASLNKLNNFRDTILPAAYNNDFGLSGGANQVYASAIELTGGYVRLQHLAVEAQTADSFAVVYKTDSIRGTIIGQGSYAQPPLIAVNKNGNALYYIKEYDGSTGPVRVSPILSGSQLAWGAMGKQVGTGVWSSGYYDMISPVVSLDPVNGTALMAWTDTRNNGTTGYDVYLRHLDDLNSMTYEPPYKRVRALPDPYGPVTTSAVLYGTSNRFTTFDGYGSYGTDPGVAPVADISDNYDLGTVNVSVYDNTGSIRSYNGKPYLDRSFTITPQNNPNGAATVTVRLFFTTAQFDALKAADSSIKTPGDLDVIKQPSGSGSGSTYSFVAGELSVPVQSWAAVDGGYYIQIQITSFSNFFIFKTNAVLPVTFLGVQAQWQNKVEALVSWQVADQQNVKNYTVQHSVNGVSFKNVYSVKATAQTQYSCVVPAGNSNYYRVMETDADGVKAFSKMAALQGVALSTILLYPNPANSVLYVQGIQKYYSLQVIDMKGNVIQQQAVISATQSLHIAGLSKGNYLLKLISKSGIQTLQFSKQ